MEQEYTYWMALAHTERMRTARKNEIIVQCYERAITLPDFFHYEEAVWQKDFDLTPEETDWLNASKKELPNYSFEAESLLEQGYELIPILSPDYPKTLKQNLKKTYAPPLLYTKGNLQLLKADSLAIVGSRLAGTVSLQFTDNICQRGGQAGTGLCLEVWREKHCRASARDYDVCLRFQSFVQRHHCRRCIGIERIPSEGSVEHWIGHGPEPHHLRYGTRHLRGRVGQQRRHMVRSNRRIAQDAADLCAEPFARRKKCEPIIDRKRRNSRIFAGRDLHGRKSRMCQ